MKILIATKNPGKYEEIREMLGQFPAEFLSLADAGITEDFVEEGVSFEENALGKARFYSKKSGLPTVADDSGIFVEALVDELGIKTRRWGVGEQATDKEWLQHFLKRMEKEKNRNATFVCAAAYAGPLGEHVFLGETRGTLTKKPEVPVKPGIPLSSVFKPQACAKVYAALSPTEKNRLSHRGKAFQKLLNFFLCSSPF
ncbi:MAG: non-canonical purine NTP pyrophosphatase [Candidatus Gracilibacteria bacterium]